MLRTALRPRWLALLVVVLVASSFAAFLGSWQLDRARERSAATVAARQSVDPVPVLSVLRARETFTGRLVDKPVTATGTWDGARQLLVTGKELDGRSGFWVLTPLVLEDGSAVGVVRGWVPTADDAAAAAPADEPVTVTGVLQPGEPPVDRSPGDPAPPAGQVDAVAPARLVQAWPHPLLTGYVVARDVAPAVAGSQALRPVPALDDGEGGFAIRNLSYAVQWWVFAAFGLFFWYRLVRDDHLGVLDAAPEPAPDPHSAGART